MKLKGLLAVLAVSLAAVTGTPAHATAISVGDGWHPFDFGGVGSSWSDDFSFTLSAPAYLKVTDAFLSGDRFDVTGLGLTSIPTSVGDSIGGDADGAYNDPAGRWSHRLWYLAAGVYDITGTVIVSPFGSGTGYAQLVATSAVPLPAALPLFGAALAGFGAIGRRLRRRQATA